MKYVQIYRIFNTSKDLENLVTDKASLILFQMKLS